MFKFEGACIILILYDTSAMHISDLIIDTQSLFIDVIMKLEFCFSPSVFCLSACFLLSKQTCKWLLIFHDRRRVKLPIGQQFGLIHIIN